MDSGPLNSGSAATSFTQTRTAPESIRGRLLEDLF